MVPDRRVPRVLTRSMLFTTAAIMRIAAVRRTAIPQLRRQSCLLMTKLSVETGRQTFDRARFFESSTAYRISGPRLIARQRPTTAGCIRFRNTAETELMTDMRRIADFIRLLVRTRFYRHLATGRISKLRHPYPWCDLACS